MKKIVVAGGGVLGNQIAFQSAFTGHDTVIWLRSPASIERAKPKIEKTYQTYLQVLESLKPLCGSDSPMYPRGLVSGLKDLTPEKIDELKAQATKAYENIQYELDMAKAVEGADLVIESVAENPEQKKEFYQKLAKVLDEDTIVVTNSSTMLPSMFAADTGRPEKFLALHFANDIYKNNTAEIMAYEGTDPAAMDAVIEFAKDINMIPLRLNKEQPGYLLNTLLVPFLHNGLQLYVDGVASPEDIDAAWMYGTGAPAGPMRILDIVGVKTAYDINKMQPGADDPNTLNGRITAELKKRLDEGRTGIAAGEGFYKYK